MLSQELLCFHLYKNFLSVVLVFYHYDYSISCQGLQILVINCYVTSLSIRQILCIAEMDDLETLTTCGICNQGYRDPRILPCDHTFCYECLTQWVQQSEDTVCVIECSHCHRVFKWPKQLLQSLKKNSLIEKCIAAVLKLKSARQLSEQDRVGTMSWIETDLKEKQEDYNQEKMKLKSTSEEFEMIYRNVGQLITNHEQDIIMRLHQRRKDLLHDLDQIYQKFQDGLKKEERKLDAKLNAITEERETLIDLDLPALTDLKSKKLKSLERNVSSIGCFDARKTIIFTKSSDLNLGSVELKSVSNYDDIILQVDPDYEKPVYVKPSKDDQKKYELLTLNGDEQVNSVPVTQIPQVEVNQVVKNPATQNNTKRPLLPPKRRPPTPTPPAPKPRLRPKKGALILPKHWDSELIDGRCLTFTGDGILCVIDGDHGTNQLKNKSSSSHAFML